MFSSTASFGAQVPTLAGGSPPIIGTNASITIQAPGYTEVYLVLALRASSGSLVALPGTDLQVYVDLASNHVIVSLPVVNGTVALSVPIPNDMALDGADLACQGFAVTAAMIGATNLLLWNVGTDASSGTMVFGNTDFVGSAGKDGGDVRPPSAQSGPPLVLYRNTEPEPVLIRLV